MNDNTSMFVLLTLGSLLGEFFGVWLIKRSELFPNSSVVKRGGKIICIACIIGFILAFIGWSLEAWA